MRKHILRERRLDRLRFAAEQDPVQMFAEAQRRTARRGLKQGTVVLQLGQVSESQVAPASSRAGGSPPAGAPVATTLIDLSDLEVQNR